MGCVLHCDMDNYYASVEEKYNPSYKRIPIAVCGDSEMRHSIVMSKNALAKKAGVLTGLSFYQAKQICPNLGYVRADYPKYLKETRKARDVYLKYTDKIVPYGMDESWVIFDSNVTIDEAKQIAEVIRIEVMYSLNLSVSVGVSYNYIFSKLGSDRNKPNGITVITEDNYKELVWPLPASDLLFVGACRKKVLMDAGIKTIGDIARSDPKHLIKLLGKVGYDLWQFANGNDRDFKPNIDKIGSIGNTITPPEDLCTDEEVSAIIYLLVKAVSARLEKHKLKTSCISICIRDSRFSKIIHQCSLKHSTGDVNIIFNKAYDLYKKHYRWDNPIRSVGVRVDNLSECEQLSLFDSENVICIDMDKRIKKLIDKFGELNVEKTATTRDW